MKYLLDTDICSYYLRGKYNLEEIFDRKGFRNLKLSIATVADLEVLAFRNPSSRINFSRIYALSQAVGVLNIERETWSIYSKLKADTLSRGAKKGDIDILIASLAKQHDMVVITNNVSHFEGLVSIENWIIP